MKRIILGFAAVLSLVSLLNGLSAPAAEAAGKPADKRPVWVIRPDGTEATLIEPLHYQMAIDGSRANWRPGR